MGNVILIESDKKLRMQIQQMLKEIGDDCLLAAFDSAEEFENVFCPADAFSRPLEQNPLLVELSEDERGYLLQNEMAKTPLPPKLNLRFQPGFGVVDQVSIPDDALLFGFEKKAIIGERLAFQNLIPTLFRKRWEQATQSLKPGANTQIRLPLLDLDRRYYFVDLLLKLDTRNVLVVDIQDANSLIVDTLNEERQRLVRLSEQDKELKPFNTINVILFRPTCVTQPPLPWVDQIFKHCKTLNYFPENSQTRFVVLKYEDDGVSKLDFIHPRIDDVIHLPLDRVLFLQKVDIVLNLPKKASPRFLFQQVVEETIEISKRAYIEKISDLGLVLINPVPLKEGTLGNFYITLPKEKDILNVFGKVMKNEKRGKQPGYNVTFGFIGLTRKVTSQIRKFLSQTKGYQPLISDRAQDFEFNPDNLFMTEKDRKIRNVIVLDVDDFQLDQTAGMINSDMNQVQVVCESSYTRLLETHLGQNSLKHMQRLRAAEPVTKIQLPADVFTIDFHRERKVVQSMAPAVTAESKMLDHAVAEWQGKDTLIKTLFPDKDLQAIFEEALALATPEKPVMRLFLCVNATGQSRAICIKISVVNTETVQLEFSAPSNEMYQKRLAGDQALSSLDAILIDAAFIPDNAESFVVGLEGAAQRKGLLQPGKNLNIIVMVDEAHAARINLKRFEHPAFRAVLIKPLDGRHLGFAISFWTENPFSIYSFNNMAWGQANFSVHMATDMVMEEISEFGASLRHPRPIAPGAVLFLRKSIYDKAPGECLAARFYRCEEHPSKKGSYLCSVTYFGINDTFMKFARTYFRETYAAAKAKESGG